MLRVGHNRDGYVVIAPIILRIVVVQLKRDVARLARHE